MEKRSNVEDTNVVDIQIATNVEKLKSGTALLDLTWRDRANCSGIDTEEFFAEKTSYMNRPLLEKVCSNCDVQLECLNFALKHDVIGWWAGTTDHSRRPIRRAMGLPEFSLDDWLAEEQQPTEVQYSEFDEEWM